MPVHPQVALLLEAVAQSPLPTLDKVPAFVARRLYSERCKVAPKRAGRALGCCSRRAA